MLRLSPLTEPAATVRESRSRSSAARYRDGALPPPETKNPAKSSGCVSNFRSPSGSVTHGCLLRVQKWTVARSHEVSSNVPARTKRSTPPILGVPVSHVTAIGTNPASGHAPAVGQALHQVRLARSQV